MHHFCSQCFRRFPSIVIEWKDRGSGLGNWIAMTRRKKGNDGDTRFERVFKQYSPTLLRYLASRVGNESEANDLAQEAYLRLIRVPDPDAIQNAEAYLFRIAANLTAEHLLKRARSPKTVDLETFEQSGEDGDENQFEALMEARSALKRLDQVLEDMPPLYRAVLLLRKREGYSHEEIAEKLGISSHTVHHYLTRALLWCRTGWSE